MRTCRVGLGILLLALAACGRPPMEADAAAGGDGAPGPSFTTSAPPTVNICSNQAVPNGSVVISARNSNLCGAVRRGQFNQFTIQQAWGSHMRVCSISRIPSGWAITQASGSNSCPESLQYGWTQNAYTIMRLNSPMRICSVSPIPGAWVVIQATTWGGCPESRVAGRPQNALVVSAVGGSEMSICRTLSAVPAGWLVTQARTDPLCPTSRESGNTFNLYVIKPVSGQQMTVCSITGVPVGWTTVARINTNSCPAAAGGNTLTIRRK